MPLQNPHPYPVENEPDDVAHRIREYCRQHPELKKNENRNLSGLDGHCYHMHEAYYHARGGYDGCELTIHCLSHKHGTHWFLRDDDRVLDLTLEEQVPRLDYHEPSARGWMSREPSNAAQQILDEISLEEGEDGAR